MPQGFFSGPGGKSMNRLLAFMAACLGIAIGLTGCAGFLIVVLTPDIVTGMVEALGLAGVGAGLLGGSEYLKNKGKQLENGG